MTTDTLELRSPPSEATGRGNPLVEAVADGTPAETGVAATEADKALPNRHTATIRLEANRKIEGFGLDDLWAYRELVVGLLHRDVMAIKNQTPAAWFWRLMAPTFTLITYTVLFEQIGKVDFKAGVPYFFIMSAAMIPWTMISSIITGAVHSITSNSGYFSKVYFPRIVLPIVSVTNAIVDFILTSLLLLGLLFYSASGSACGWAR
jgi:lipopolysaccharide transport system permease protein